MLNNRLTQSLGAYLLCLLPLQVYSQEFYGYYKNEKIAYSIANDKFLISFKNENVKVTEKQIFTIDSLKRLGQNNLFIAYVGNGNISNGGKLVELMNKLRVENEIGYVSPIIMNKEGREIGGLSDQIIVKLKKQTSLTELEALIAKLNAKLIKQYEFNSQTYFISMHNNASGNALNLANTFYETGLFEYAEPKFHLFIKQAAVTRNRPLTSKNLVTDYYPQQWALNNTGQTGGTADADMDVPEAWAITTGSSSVKIAIVDDGVQIGHPDIDPNWVAGYDETGGFTGCPDGGTYGQPNLCSYPEDSHGTRVAGIAVASGDVMGVAPGSKIVPIRVYQGESGISDNDWVASGIYHAISYADIINMSFSLDTPFGVIDDAIEYGRLYGRGSKGSIMLAATQNYGIETISFPSSNADVIAVGASTHTDARYPDSNWGYGLDVTAPGLNVYTTDITGAKGKSSGDHFLDTGNSLSCPAVSGIMALMLSVNSNLTAVQARLILESTTDKVSTSTYTYSSSVSGQPNGTWNYEMGYGRVNAYRAVRATTSANLTGSDRVCTSANYSLEVVPNVTISWSTSNSSVLTINSSGVASRVGSSNGWVDVIATYSSSMASYSISKAVYVGAPSAPTSLVTMMGPSSNELCRNADMGLAIGNTNHYPQGVTQYNWDFGSWNSYFTGYIEGGFVTTQRAMMHLNGSSPSSQNISVTAQNSCGAGPAYSAYFYAVSCGGFRMAYPNPVKDVLTLTFDESPVKLPQQITLYSEDSQKAVYSLAEEKIVSSLSKENTLQIPVKNLPRGTYYLHFLYKCPGKISPSPV